VEIIGDPGPVVQILAGHEIGIEVDGSTIYVRAGETDPYPLIRDALADAGATMRRLAARSTTLEDIFLATETDE
jgi:hypothetical protein